MASRARPSGLQAAVLAHKERQEEKVEEVVAMGGTVAWEAGGETGGSSTELELLLCFLAGGGCTGDGMGMPGGTGSRAPGGTWIICLVSLVPIEISTWALRIMVNKACACAGSRRLAAGCRPGGRRPCRKAVGKLAGSLRLASVNEVAGGKRKGGKGNGEPP